VSPRHEREGLLVSEYGPIFSFLDREGCQPANQTMLNAWQICAVAGERPNCALAPPGGRPEEQSVLRPGPIGWS
jgi:hypothetical protein